MIFLTVLHATDEIEQTNKHKQTCSHIMRRVMRREHKSTSGFAFSRKFAKRAREFHSSRSAARPDNVSRRIFRQPNALKEKLRFTVSAKSKRYDARLAGKLQRRFPRSPSGLASTGKSATLLMLAREIVEPPFFPVGPAYHARECKNHLQNRKKKREEGEFRESCSRGLPRAYFRFPRES